MDVPSAAAALTAVHQSNIQAEAATLTLKKSMEIQQSSAMQLIDAVPPPPETPSTDPGATVGSQVNTYA